MFEWEENVFLGLKAAYRRLVETPRERSLAAVRAELSPLRHQLFLVAQMIAERPVKIIETPNRVLCDLEHVFLPPEYAIAGSRAENEALFLLKTLLASLCIRRHAMHPTAPSPALREAAEDFIADYPLLKARIDDARMALGREEQDLWAVLGEASFKTTKADRSQPTEAPGNSSANEDHVTEIEGRGQTGVTSLEDGGDQPVESEMPIHTFEKAETLEEYTGLNRKSDDDDELKEHEEALRSVDMKNVIRSHERPRSIYRSDMVVEGPDWEVNDATPSQGIPYPEWNHRKAAYHPDWCFVHQTRQDSTDEQWLEDVRTRHCGLVLDLKKKFASIANEWLKAKRQPTGPEFDLDAVIEGQVARHLGQAPNEFCYIDRKRDLHDVAALILMDTSYSTDSWVDDARVLDTIRETMFCVGEVLEDFIERFAIASFHSNTRRHCAYQSIKGFDETWHGTMARLGGLEAQGYSRIGTALRHAHEQLIRESAERKVVILITDGRPCDYDRYEGTYGIQDVRKAIHTGTRHGILTHAFAVEKRAQEHFPLMFTQHHYDILPTPRALADRLCSLFLKLKQR
ncbi:MAG: VWA domain-containing protein [Verrucomicrobiales bacterium]